VSYTLVITDLGLADRCFLLCGEEESHVIYDVEGVI